MYVRKNVIGAQMAKKCWILRNQDKKKIQELSGKLGLHPLVVHVMLNRGLETEDEMLNFLHPDMQHFHDPFLLKGMDQAAARIRQGIQQQEKIAVYGDYDVDGITSVSVLYLLLKELGADVTYLIPDRLKEGYGVNANGIQRLKSQGVSLIVTVDCGITAVSEVNLAKQLGIDMIITDHHQCPSELPDAVAVINPKQPDCSYPFPDLAGVGVAFKLAQALIGEEKLPYLVKRYGPLVALGTVADIVPLKDENRVIVHYGMKYMQQSSNPGIRSLLKISGFPGKAVDAGTLGFQLAPRINAAGRIGNADMGVKLFLSQTEEQADILAKQLDEENARRKEIEQSIFEEARQLLQKNPSLLSQNIIILKHPGWHHGVIGIVASRLTEEYYKPCILFSEEAGVCKGSARSVKGFNIYDALCAVSRHVERFGGHELAAGLTVGTQQFDVFQKELEQYCRLHVTEELLVQQIALDAPLQDKDMTCQLAEELKRLEPYGMGNPNPNFLVQKSKVVNSTSLKEGKHLKLSLCQGEKYIDAIGFSMGQYSSILKSGDHVSIAGQIYINEFRGERYFSIRIKDIRLS